MWVGCCNNDTKKVKNQSFTCLLLDIIITTEHRISNRCVGAIAKQFEKSRARGYTNEDILLEWSTKGWRSYKDEWMKVPVKKQATTYTPPADYDPLASLRDM